jgi:hypothetical protein
MEIGLYEIRIESKLGRGNEVLMLRVKHFIKLE